MLLPLMFYPVCGFADDKTDTPQAVESQTANSDQTTDKTSPKNETKKDQTLEPIVVTATRTPQSISDVPADVSVVTSADIASRDVQTVDAAMNLLPGVFDLRTKPLDTTGSVTLRGFPEQKRTLVLLDGEPLNDGYNNQVDWNSLNVEDISRIEVAKGPFSSLYGGNAMGGVINIITKTPQEREVTIKSGYGSDNTWNEYASYGDKLYDRLSVFVSYGYRQSDGYPTVPVTVQPGTGPGKPVNGGVPTTDPYGDPQYIIGNWGNNNWWTESGSLKLNYDISPDSKAFFSYRVNQYGYGYNNPQDFLTDSSGSTVWNGPVTFQGSQLKYNEASFLGDWGRLTENHYNGGYETHICGDAVLKISAGLLDIPDNWYATPDYYLATRAGGPGSLATTPGQVWHNNVQLSFPVFERNLITVGGDFRHEEAAYQTYNLTNWKDAGSQTDLTGEGLGKDNIFSLYSQAEIALIRNVTLYAGVRGDYWKAYDGMSIASEGSPAQYYDSKDALSINPKGSIVYKPLEDTSLRASIGTAFRPPNVYELYTTWSYFGLYNFLANPNLNPETSFSWDLGLEQKLRYNTVVKINYFNNTIDNYIYPKTISFNPVTYATDYQNENAGKAATNGVEFGIENKPWECLKVFSNATYTHSEMLQNSADPLSVGKQLPWVPEWMFNLGGEVTYRDFTFTLTGRYVSKQYGNADNTDKVNGVYGSYDPFFTADFCARYKLTKWATLDFSIKNIMDRNYFSYYQAPGRQFFGGVTAKF